MNTLLARFVRTNPKAYKLADYFANKRTRDLRGSRFTPKGLSVDLSRRGIKGIQEQDILGLAEVLEEAGLGTFNKGVFTANPEHSLAEVFSEVLPEASKLTAGIGHVYWESGSVYLDASYSSDITNEEVDMFCSYFKRLIARRHLSR